jgi:hypothetical protein
MQDSSNEWNLQNDGPTSFARKALWHLGKEKYFSRKGAKAQRNPLETR